MEGNPPVILDCDILRTFAKTNRIISRNKTIIWAAWGTLIKKIPFLIKCLTDICNLSIKYDCKWVSIGKESKLGHPHHPLYLNANEKPIVFNIHQYLEKIHP